MMCESMTGALPKCHPALHHQRGVTLVELMIALVIGLLVTVAMLKVYVDASLMYRFNEGLPRVQENGRFVLEFIRRDARVAGFWGCYSDAARSNGISKTSGAYNPGFDPQEEEFGHITGTDNDSGDSITFRSASGSGSLVTVGMSGIGDSVTLDSDSASVFATGTAALISDCENGDVFQITDISGTALAHAAGAGANASPNLSKAYAAGAQVYEARQTTFCIAPGADPAQPALRRLVNPTPGQTCASNGLELLEGIENMQIFYGEDTDADTDGANGDGTANRYVAFGTSGLDTDRIVSVRISVLVRSLNNSLTTEPAPYAFPDPDTTVTPGSTDKYLRKVFTTTITLRNKAG